MTPLELVHAAAAYFASGKPIYGFNVPEGKDMRSYCNRVRSHAKRRGYHWRVAYHSNRCWLIKVKL